MDFSKKWDFNICKAERKALINCVFAAHLICVFVFAYTERFSCMKNQKSNCAYLSVFSVTNEPV